MATVWCKKLQGIPLPGTPFKIMHIYWRRFIFTTQDKTLFLRDSDTNRMELFFELIPASAYPERYIIRSVNTNLALKDDSKADGHSDGLGVQDVNQNSKKQIWSIEPSSKFPKGYYRIKNSETDGYLLNGPTHAGNYLRTFDLEEYEDQSWTFIFTEGLGIPPVHTEMTIRNEQTSRIVYTDGKMVFVRDAVSNLTEQLFVLVPSKLRPESYLIQALILKTSVRPVAKRMTDWLQRVPISRI